MSGERDHGEGAHHHDPGEHHEGSEHGRTLWHYTRDFMENWRTYEGSLARKVVLGVKNRTRAALPPFCCGHPGEPGC